MHLWLLRDIDAMRAGWRLPPERLNISLRVRSANAAAGHTMHTQGELHKVPVCQGACVEAVPTSKGSTPAWNRTKGQGIMSSLL